MPSCRKKGCRFCVCLGVGYLGEPWVHDAVGIAQEVAGIDGGALLYGADGEDAGDVGGLLVAVAVVVGNALSIGKGEAGHERGVVDDDVRAFNQQVLTTASFCLDNFFGTAPDPAAVRSLASQKEVAAEALYGADGKQADSYRRGVTVVKQTYTDGTTSTRKVIK